MKTAVAPEIVWANNGDAFEVDINGVKTMVFAATVDLKDGKPVQKFQGESYKEIADKLLQAQANATARIRELTPEEKSQKKPPTEFSQKPLSADDRFELAQDITNPEKAADAINRVVESELGAPLAEVREILQEGQDEKLKKAVKDAMQKFLDITPDFEPCQHNEGLIIRYGEMHNLPPTEVDSYTQIWTALKDAGLVIVKEVKTDDADPTNVETAEPGERQQRELPGPTAVSRPRLAASSTSLRRGDSDDAPSRVSKPKYTRADVDAMPLATYQDKLKNEPGFAALVDALK